MKNVYKIHFYVIKYDNAIVTNNIKNVIKDNGVQLLICLIKILSNKIKLLNICLLNLIYYLKIFKINYSNLK
jgi:hypothetical protein